MQYRDRIGDSLVPPETSIAITPAASRAPARGPRSRPSYTRLRSIPLHSVGRSAAAPAVHPKYVRPSRAETASVFERSAIGIVTLVEALRKERLEQIAVRRMDLDRIISRPATAAAPMQRSSPGSPESRRPAARAPPPPLPGEMPSHGPTGSMPSTERRSMCPR